MKLLNFIQNSEVRLGIKLENYILDVSRAKKAQALENCPEDIFEVMENEEASISKLQNLVDIVSDANLDDFFLNESELTFAPSIPRPNKIICVGLNYRKHALETDSPIPDIPIIFSKFNNSLTGHQSTIVVPNVTNKLDYEAELAIVIGKKTRNVPREKALDHAFGYCCANDLSARDLQLQTSQWLLGKTGDDFNPLGPYLVTKDEVGNPNELNIKSIVNGDVRQNSNTSDMIFSCEEIISYLSQYMTLEAGDVILTGTPEGVVMGYPPEKQVYLRPGDTVTIQIDRLGSLTNFFVEDKE